MQHRDRHGFTLVELMLAITLTAGLLLTGRLLLDQIADSEHRMISEGRVIHAAAARERTLRELFRNVEVGTSDSATFGGDERTMHFTSWCDSAAGLRSRCDVSLAIDTAVTAVLSTAATAPEGRITLARDTVTGTFLYLGDAHNGGQWFRTWGTSITAPIAVGIVFGLDTTVLRIGDRG